MRPRRYRSFRIPGFEEFKVYFLRQGSAYVVEIRLDRILLFEGSGVNELDAIDSMAKKLNRIKDGDVQF